MFLAYHKIGTNREQPRLWLESKRLARLGFTPGASYDVRRLASGVMIYASGSGTRTVSSKRGAGSVRPVLDLNSRAALAGVADFCEVRVEGSMGLLRVSPSIRAAAILRHSSPKSTYRVLDVFCGGGTASAAFDSSRFEIVAGIEIEPAFADEWEQQHPNATLIQGDLRSIHPGELPEVDGIIAGIPCTSHSPQGRAKKSLAGVPELGDTGDLYIPLLALVAQRMPSFVVIENVPSYGNSLAGMTIESHLRKIGYHVTSSVLEPNTQFGEPCNRRRWCCVATLRQGFEIPNPGICFDGRTADWLDAPDPERDRIDAERIAATVAGLRRHNARHAEKGHRFFLTELDGSENNFPTFTKSYHKINSSGAFVKTPYGLRMVRPEEVCRIHGHSFHSTDAATIYKMSGQGVLTRVFRHVANALAEFLP